MANLGDLMVTVGAKIDGFEKAMGTVSQRLNAIDREATRALSGFDKAGQRLVGVGTAITAGITVPLGGIVFAAERAAEGFQSSMNRVSALGGITGTALDDLRKQALKLGADTAFSAKDAADAMAVYAGASFNAAQVSQAMAGTLDLAAAGQIEVGEAAKLTADILGQFGLAAGEAGKVADTLAGAGKDAKASMAEMGLTLSYVGVPAKQMGLSLQETVAAILALDTAGIRAEKAGTGLRGVLASLVAPSTQAATEMQKLGIRISDASGNILPFSNIIEQFRTALSKVGSEAEKQRIVFEVFGREAGTSAMALINTGGPALDKFTEKLNAAGGAAKEQAKVLQQGLPGAMEQLKGSVESAAISLGQSLAPSIITLAGVVKTAADAVSEFFQWFQSLPQPIQTAAIAITAVTAAVGPLALGIGALISSFTTISGFIFTATGALTTFGGGIAAAAAASTTFAATALPAAIAALRTFALSTIPQTITALAVMAEVMLTQAAASFITFARTAIPAAISALTTFAVTTIPASIAGVATFASTTIPAATAALVTFARTGVASAIAALTTFATTAIPAALSALGTIALTALPLLTVAALTAASAFGGWHLGKWAYDQIPGFKALGDTIADFLLKLPLVESALLRMSGATAATVRAQGDLDFATKKLEESLRAKGITVDRAGRSTDEYSRALLAAAKNAGVATGDLEKAFKTLGVTSKDTLTKNLKEAQAAVVTIEKAFKEGKASADDLAKAKAALKSVTDGLRGSVGSAKTSQEQLNETVKKAKEAYDSAARAYLAGKASAEQLEQANIRLRAAQDAADPTRVLERSARAWEETYDRIDKEIADYIAAAQRLNEVNRQVEESNRDLAKTFTESHEAMRKASLEIVNITAPLPQVVKDAVALQEAMKRVGGTTIYELDRAAEQAEKDYDRIRESGIAAPDAILKAELAYIRASIEARRAHGDTITKEEEDRLRQLEDQLGQHTERQIGQWEGMMRQISTIMSDLGKDIASAIIGIFQGNPENDRLRSEAEALRDSLAQRTADWEQYQQDVAAQLEAIRAKHAEELAQQEADLMAALDKKRADYEQYVADVTAEIEQIRAKHAEELAGEIADLMDAQRQKEIEYGEYQEETISRIAEVRETHAEQLAAELEDLRSNLADKQEEYEDFVADVATKLGRLKIDTEDDIGDETRSTARKVADKQKAFKREEEDTKKKIARLRSENKKGNEAEIADLEKALERKREDTEEYIRRENEDLQDFIEEKRRKQQQEEADLRQSLERRTREHQQYIADVSNKEQEITNKHREAVDKQVSDLIASLNKRGEALLKFREETAAKIAAITEDHRKAQDKEIADLQAGLARRTAEWEKYKADTIAKLEEIREKARIELEADERKLAEGLAKARAEFDKYVIDTNAKLAEIESQFTGVWDRVGDAFKQTLESMGEAIIRFGVEYLEGKLFKWFRDVFLDDILAKVGKAIVGIFSDQPLGSGGGGASIPTGGGGGSIPGGGGGGIPGGGGAAGGALGAVNAATGIVSAISDVITAIYSIRQEGTMNQIERNTAQVSINLVTLIGEAQKYWPRLLDIQTFLFGPVIDILREIRDVAKNFVSISIALENGSEEAAKILGAVVSRAQHFDTTATDRLSDIHFAIRQTSNYLNDTLVTIREAIISQGALMTGQLANIADKMPSTLEKILGIGGGIGGTGGGVGNGGSILGALLPDRQQNALNQIERNTAQVSINLVNLISEAQKHWPEIGYLREYVTGAFHNGFVDLLDATKEMRDVLKRIEGKEQSDQGPIRIEGFGDSESFSGLYVTEMEDLKNTIRPMAAQVGQIVEMMRGYSPSVLGGGAAPSGEVQAVLGDDAVADLTGALRGVTAAIDRLSLDKQQPVPVQQLTGAGQWLAEIRNSLYYFVGLPWPELISHILGREIQPRQNSTASAAVIDVTPVVNAVTALGADMSKASGAVRDAVALMGADASAKLSALRDQIAVLIDPFAADMRNMMREFTGMPWRPALERIGDKQPATIIIEANSRTMARWLVDDITSEQVLRLKLGTGHVY